MTPVNNLKLLASWSFYYKVSSSLVRKSDHLDVIIIGIDDTGTIHPRTVPVSETANY